MIAESGRLSQSVRYEDCKARVELLCRALESLSVADDGVFYDSAGDDESDRPPWTVRRIIERGPGSRVDDGPLDADIVVRKTGLLTAGRNPGGRNGPRPPAVDDRRQQRCFRRAITPRPLDCGSGPLPRAGVFLPECPQRSVAGNARFPPVALPTRTPGASAAFCDKPGSPGAACRASCPAGLPLQGHTAPYRSADAVPVPAPVSTVRLPLHWNKPRLGKARPSQELRRTCCAPTPPPLLFEPAYRASKDSRRQRPFPRPSPFPERAD